MFPARLRPPLAGRGDGGTPPEGQHRCQWQGHAGAGDGRDRKDSEESLMPFSRMAAVGGVNPSKRRSAVSVACVGCRERAGIVYGRGVVLLMRVMARGRLVGLWQVAVDGLLRDGGGRRGEPFEETFRRLRGLRWGVVNGLESSLRTRCRPAHEGDGSPPFGWTSGRSPLMPSSWMAAEGGANPSKRRSAVSGECCRRDQGCHRLGLSRM
jgi:hypothetical protein